MDQITIILQQTFKEGVLLGYEMGTIGLPISKVFKVLEELKAIPQAETSVEAEDPDYAIR